MSALSTPAGGGILTAASSSGTTSASSTTSSSATSATPGTTLKGTASGKSKFQTLDINNLYCHGKSENSEPTSSKSHLSRKHGMQSLGKVPSARRPPANLPSLKTESGLDSNSTSASQANTGQSATPVQQPQQQQVTGSGAASAPPASSAASAPQVGPSPSAVPAHSAPQAPHHSHQICQPQNTSSHPHASGYQGGWAGLPPHRTAQFQQEFPSLDGSTPTPSPPVAAQNSQQASAGGGGAGPALRPHTEGGWLAGGGGRAEGPAPVADSRSTLARTVPLPSFMVKGSTGMGGGGFPAMLVPAPARGGPPRGPPHHAPHHSQQSGHHPSHHHSQTPPPQVHHRARDVPTIEKLMQRPIIKEEELNSMDQINKDAGWAIHDDIDYNQKLAFSDDDESTPSKDTSNSKSGKSSQQDKEKDSSRDAPAASSNSGGVSSSNSINNMNNNMSVSSGGNSGTASGNSVMGGAREPAVLAKNKEDDEIWAMRQRQRNQEVSAAVERARQRQEEEERRYHQQQQLQDKDDKSWADSQQGTQSTLSQDWSKDPPEKSPSSGRDSDTPRPHSHGPPSLDRSASRDSVRNGPVDQVSSDFKQIGSESRNFRDNKDRDRPRDRDYQRDRDFYRDNRDRESDRDWERDTAPPRDRDRDGARQDRESSGFNKYFNSHLPPRFAKQQGRGGGQQERMGFERVEFARSNSGNSFNDSNKHRNDPRNEEQSPLSIQFTTSTSRWSFQNMKNAPGGVQREPFKRGQDDKGMRRDREMKDGMDKGEDRRRERHTPDEPRGQRHPTRKLSGSSDGRHQSNRDYDDREDDYNRWDKDHDRRSGSNLDDKKHPEYNEREGSYDWRSSDKDYGSDKNRNYRDMDRQSSRESQKDYDRKSSDSYEPKNNAEKFSEVFDRKCSGQDFSDKKSIEKYDRERREDRQDVNKQPERPDSRNSRNSRESAKDTFKQDSFSDKEFQGNSWADFPEPLDKESSNHNKNTNVSNNSAAPKAGFQEKPNFADKVESKNESYPSGNYRDRKDYKSDSDESKRSGYGQQHMKKVPSNLKKTDLPSKDKSRSEDSQSVGGKDDPNANVPTKTESSPKAWADSLVPSSIVSENNIKNQNVESKIENNNKETESNKTERKQQDSGKEKAERKLSSSGSEKKSQTGSRNRLDSGGSRKAYVFYNRDRSRWERGRSDGSRRRPGKGRNSRDPMYSESEVSGDEERTKNNLVSADGANKGNRRNVGGQFSNERKRHDGREAFAPRGEPSRRGRGSFRGRGAVHSGYPPSSKSPFGLSNASTSGVAENEESKAVDSLTPDEKMKLKQQALGAGISGKDRRGGGHGKGSQEKGKKISGAPASTEEEAWETTSEHSEAGSRVGKAGMGNKTLRSHENKDKKQVGQSQTRGGNPPANNRQNSSGSINKGSQPNKKEIPPFGSNTITTVNRVDDIKYSDVAAVTVALGDMKISGPTKPNKPDQKLDKDTEESPEILEDGFQEVKSKNKEKGPRVGGPPSIKDEPQNCNRQLNQKGQQTNKVTEQSHKNNQSRNSSEKSASGGTTRSANTGPPAPISKVNGPQNVPSHERHSMGPPPNKPNQFDRPRQSNLPPRLVKQREHNRMQKHGQGFNQSGTTEVGSASVPIVSSSAWDKPISQTLRANENEQPISSSISNPEANDIGVPENHSEQSSQRSAPSNQTNDQKAPGNREKATTFDGTTTPVQTIIFENTNYKSAPSDALKQKFASGPVSQCPAQPNGSQPQSKSQQSTCAPAKPIVSITSQTSDLDHPILSFATENQQTNAFMTDFNQDSQQGSSKPEATPLQLPMSFIPKPSEDSSDMKLDFFDSDLSQLAEDKTGKGLGMRSMRSISSPSQNTMSTATDQELNMKIASVKKVWDTSTVVEHPVADESGHGQHNLAAQHMSVSSPHSLTSQHNISSHHMSSQHTLTQQLGSPHGITQHTLVSQHGLGNQHNMTVSSPSVQFTSSFEDHQNNTDVSQSQGFSPGANGNISNQTTNVCKVKPTQQTIHSSQGLSQSTLQNMQASLISQQATTALQSMGNVGQSIQGVGGVMGLSPPPMPHTYNHINYPPSQYGGISAIPSPPTVVFNSSQQLLNSSQQLPSQGGLYNAFQIDQSRSQFGAFPGGPYGAGSTPYNYQPQDMFQGLQGQYRMQELFQAAGSAAFGQSGQLGTNPSTVLISSSTNSLMSATVKPSTQQIGAIGSKASSYGGQQYLGYGGPHEAGGAAPPPYAAALPPPSLVRTAPPPQAAPPPPPQLQPPNTYYSQSTGGQTGFFQQPGSVSANYGLQFGQPNQNHNNATLQGFGSQVMSNQFQIAAAMQQQYGRAQQQQASAATPYGVSTGQQQSGPGASAVAVAAQVKQDHHQPRPQQLKSPLQDHPNNGMFCNLSQQPPQSAPPTPYTSVPPPQPPHVQQHAQSGTHSPKGGTPNPNSKQNNSNNSNVGVVSGNSAVGGGNSMVSGSVYQQQGIKQQHSPPHHKYPNYQHMQQVVQGNGRQASLSMAINRGGGGSIPQQRYPPPIQRPPPPLIHPPPPSYGYPNYRGGNNPSNSRHTGNNGGPKQSGGFYQQNNRSSHQTVPPSPSDQAKGVAPSGEDNCPSPTVTTPSESQVASVSSPAQPPATTPTNIEVPVDKKSE